jgi:hypothetical protein
MIPFPGATHLAESAVALLQTQPARGWRLTQCQPIDALPGSVHSPVVALQTEDV